jgi:hypothetical protein
MFDVCTTGDTAQIDAIFKFQPHTRVNMGQHGHYIHSHRLAARMWIMMKTTYWGKIFWVVPCICTGFVNTCLKIFL